jgi:hypothetical protein
MLILKFIVLVLAFFVTLLWLTKLVTDCVSFIFGAQLPDEQAKADGTFRIILIGLMSILWPLVIIMS